MDRLRVFRSPEMSYHLIAIGEVHVLDLDHPHSPLLFFRGGYGQFSPFIKPVG